MSYEAEFNLLRKTLGKNRINVRLISLKDLTSATEDAFNEILIISLKKMSMKDLVDHIINVISKLKDHTIYRVFDLFDFHYLFLKMHDEKFVVVGPYSTTPYSNETVMNICEKNNIPPKRQKYLNDYYMNVPYVGEDDILFSIIDAFAEIVWNTTAFSFVDSLENTALQLSGLEQTPDSYDENFINTMHIIEQRYAYENKLIRAVKEGQIHVVKSIMTGINSSNFKMRTPDHLRDMKNYCIITNTLLRKAAESGGVHPVYLDNVSSSFALQIEQLPSAKASNALIRSLFITYCNLVRNNTTKGLLPIVQEAVLYISNNLYNDLSLNTVAESLSVSKGYLSAVFKKEMGKTLTEFVAEKRINHAIHLLTTTQLQVQTIALHCGFPDRQYFSKTFKRITGKTPKDFRK